MKKILLILTIVLVSCSDKEAIKRNNIVVDFATLPKAELFKKYGEPKEDYSIPYEDQKVSNWDVKIDENKTAKAMLIYHTDKREKIKEMRFTGMGFGIFFSSDLDWIAYEKYDSFYKKMYVSGIEGVRKCTYHEVPKTLQIQLDYVSDKAFKYQ